MIGLKVKDIMSKDAVTADKREPVMNVINLLLKYDIGAVLITDGGDSPYGIVTQRDIMECVSLKPEKYRELTAADIARTSLVTVEPELDAILAFAIMKINLINRLPVVSDGRIRGMITYRDITNVLKESFDSLEVSHKNLKEKMKVDFLTGVYNKGYMDEELSYFIERSILTGVSFTLLLIDIDNFKDINDTYGHVCGDMILNGAAQTLVEKSRNVSIVGRFGGDEFIIIVPYSDYNSSAYMAERLRMALEERAFSYEGTEVRVTASIGLIEWTYGIKSGEEMLRLADNCLYEAKRSGKNRVSVCGLDIIKDKPVFVEALKTNTL